MTQRSGAVPDLEIAAAVNNHAVLSNCLARSPDISEGRLNLRTYEGFRTAGEAYNKALDETAARVLIFAHQDVYLPMGFLEGALEQVSKLDILDRNWALAGVSGLDGAGTFRGRTWSSGLGAVLGKPFETPVEIETLDEMLLFVNRRSELRFDPELPSFHLYAADAVLSAKARDLRSYVVHTPAVHHSRAVVALDGGYRQAYRYMQRKWRAQLPVPNLVCPITRSPFTLMLRDWRIRRRHKGRERPPEPCDDPSVIARRIGFELMELDAPR
ncbi:hypothetical protein [Phenylobacterium sp.]|uniref:hypothetical protein n=1 Tax=Phenylobacterium sp. TaxID=1871053 RepID=UPI00301BB5C1